MTRNDFEGLVSDALDQIPGDLAAQMDNVVVLVEDDAPDQSPTMLGLYVGIPLTERDPMWGGMLPDRIMIYRNPILDICETEQDVIDEVLITVVHEVAHHFGIDEDRLHELGWG